MGERLTSLVAYLASRRYLNRSPGRSRVLFLALLGFVSMAAIDRPLSLHLFPGLVLLLSLLSEFWVLYGVNNLSRAIFEQWLSGG